MAQNQQQKGKIKKMMKKYRSDGLVALIIAILEKVITHSLSYIIGTSTSRIGMYNGVAVRNVSLLSHRDVFEHEEQLIESIRKFITGGEKVVLIGAGTGASTVCAARQVNSDGIVNAYEASSNAVSTCNETFRLNKVEDIANCQHAVIETAIHVIGNSSNAEQLSATDLPDSDVLVMDCEGAESEILKNINQYPDKIIVESHSHFNSSSKDIKNILSSRYKIICEMERSENIDVLTFEKRLNQ